MLVGQTALVALPLGWSAGLQLITEFDQVAVEGMKLGETLKVDEKIVCCINNHAQLKCFKKQF